MADTSGKRPGYVVGLIQLVVVIAVVGAALVLTRLLNQSGESREPVQRGDMDRRTAVSLVTPEVVTLTPSLRLTGSVDIRASTSIIPQVGGRVVSVSPDFVPGGAVSRGDTLFQIERADFELAIEQVEAEIAAAGSELLQLRAEAQLAQEEWEELYPGREINDLAARRPQIAAAEARLKSSQANKRVAELALARTTIVAPFDGRVLNSQLDVGQVVSPNVAVGTVYARDAVEISAPISEAELERLQPVTDRVATILAPGEGGVLGEARVVRVDAQLDPRTRLGRLFLETGDLPVQAGQFVELTLPLETVDGAFSLPETVLGARDRVFVVEDGTLASRQVRIIETRDGRIVTRAFDTADGVVRLPPVDASDGDAVTIRGKGGAS